MKDTFIRGRTAYRQGYNSICSMDDQYQSLMDFGVITLGEGESYHDDSPLERAFLLVSGKATLQYEAEDLVVSRSNCFDENPWVLHVGRSVSVSIVGGNGGCEFCVQRTENEEVFDARVYAPSECRVEQRGQGTMNETSTRIVRTVFDKSNAPYSNLVLGEVVGYPGKWSSYPPHYHTQPEIYHYRTLPCNGFGYCDLGNEILRVQDNDTVVISKGQIHPHVTAPGYALWYLWVIRHLNDDPYITPVFVEEHKWVAELHALIWPDKA